MKSLIPISYCFAQQVDIRYGTVGTYLPAYIICPGGGGLPYLLFFGILPLLIQIV